MNDILYYVLISFFWWQVLSATVISAGYHRYFAHKSYDAPVWYEYLVLMLGPLSGAGHVLGWVGVHRMHHAYSDTEHDPHSPKFQGFWKVLTSTFRVPHIPRRFIKDMLRNKRIVFFYKNHLYVRLAVLLVGYIVFPLEYFVAFFVAPVFYGYLGFGLINALCHKDGKVRNSALANMFTGGEGWHANHHDRGRDWRIGRTWWQWDPGALWISLIKVDKNV